MKLLALSSLIVPTIAHVLNDEVVIGNEHIIELSPGNKQTATFEELLALKREKIQFFDITNFDEDSISTNITFPEAIYPKKTHQNKKFAKLAPSLSAVELELKLRTFTSFYTRYARSSHGVESCTWLYNQIREMIGNRTDISIEVFRHEWLQSSILVRIEGSENPDKVIVVGAHQDSINLVLPSIMPAPGADDDGSGAMTTLEVFRVLMESDYKPKNTVEFHWYSAEELGLLGSQDVFSNYSSSNVDVRAMLQQDMTGYSAGSFKNEGHDEMGLITDFVNPELTEYLKLLISTYCDIPYAETECGYACSDHASAGKYGYQSAFVIESQFSNVAHQIHTTEDTADYLDFYHMLEHAKLTLGYVLELGSADI